jgi:hypothetical protein
VNKPDDYLRREYGDRFRVRKGEDGIWNLQTRHKPKDGTLFEVYDYSDTHLAACLPTQAAKHLLRQYPETFTVHQDADDGVVLLFEEGRLRELADALKLRRKKQISEDERRRLAEMSIEHSPLRQKPISEGEQVA